MISEIGKYFKNAETAMSMIIGTVAHFNINDSKLGLEAKSNAKVTFAPAAF